MQYKNLSKITKTFRGVAFKPGETKSVNGFINDPCMIAVKDAPVKKESTATASSKAAETPKKAEVK